MTLNAERRPTVTKHQVEMLLEYVESTPPTWHIGPDLFIADVGALARAWLAQRDALEAADELVHAAATSGPHGRKGCTCVRRHVSRAVRGYVVARQAAL